MKYITYRDEESQDKIMVIFAEVNQHAVMAAKMNVWPLSAGHLTFSSKEGTLVVEVECFGESTTLDLTPEDEDTLIAKRLLGL